MREADARIAQLLRSTGQQGGLFTFKQALAAGFPRSTVAYRTDRGQWIRVNPGVYKIAGTPPSEHEFLIAAWLACGEPAAICGLAATATWGLEAPPPEMPEIVVPVHRSVSIAGIRTMRTRRWSNTEMVRRGPVRITSPMRTLLDLAPRIDGLALELALDDAHRQKLVQLERFRGYLDAAVRRGISGASLLREYVDVRDPDRPNDSGGETKLFRRLRLARIPVPISQFWIQTRSGPRRIDRAYPEQKVALEFDSFRWHDGRVRFDNDRARDGELADAGWERRYITSTMLDDPAPTLEWTVATALGLRPATWRPA